MAPNGGRRALGIFFISGMFIHSFTQEILQAPESTVVFLNQTAVFTCETDDGDVTGWRVNGTRLQSLPPEIHNDLHVSGSNTDEGTRVETLTIPARAEYNGTGVQCVVVGYGSSVQSGNATLQIQGPPSAVADLKTTRNATSITISWEAPWSLDVTGVDHDVHYNISCFNVTDENNPTPISCTDCTNITETVYTFTPDHLSPCHVYKFSVTPFNGAGQGESSGNATNCTEGCSCSKLTVLPSSTPTKTTVTKGLNNEDNQTVPVAVIVGTICAGIFLIVVLLAVVLIIRKRNSLCPKKQLTAPPRRQEVRYVRQEVSGRLNGIQRRETPAEYIELSVTSTTKLPSSSSSSKQRSFLRNNDEEEKRLINSATATASSTSHPLDDEKALPPPVEHAPQFTVHPTPALPQRHEQPEATTHSRPTDPSDVNHPSGVREEVPGYLTVEHLSGFQPVSNEDPSSVPYVGINIPRSKAHFKFVNELTNNPTSMTTGDQENTEEAVSPISQGNPTVKDDMKLLLSVAADRWKMIASGLGFNEDLIDEIDTNNEMDEACLQDCVERWADPSWERLSCALRDLGEDSLAQQALERGSMRTAKESNPESAGEVVTHHSTPPVDSAEDDTRGSKFMMLSDKGDSRVHEVMHFVAESDVYECYSDDGTTEDVEASHTIELSHSVKCRDSQNDDAATFLLGGSSHDVSVLTKTFPTPIFEDPPHAETTSITTQVGEPDKTVELSKAKTTGVTKGAPKPQTPQLPPTKLKLPRLSRSGRRNRKKRKKHSSFLAKRKSVGQLLDHTRHEKIKAKKSSGNLPID